MRSMAADTTYISRVRVQPVDGPLKYAWLPAEDEPIVIGSHGALAAHHGFPTGPPYARPSAIDYLVASLTACLSGTLAGALQARGIDVRKGGLVSESAAEVAPEDDGVLVVRRSMCAIACSLHRRINARPRNVLTMSMSAVVQSTAQSARRWKMQTTLHIEAASSRQDRFP